jgi:hypothetical protein
MHKMIQDEVKSLEPGKLSYLPSYLAQLYSYRECQLEIEINDINVIRDIYGIADSDEEEFDSEKTEEGSTDESSKADSEMEEGDDGFHTGSQPKSTDLEEPLQAAAVGEVEVSRPQKSGIAERQAEKQEQALPVSSITRGTQTMIQEEVGQNRIPMDHMETRIEQGNYVYQPQTGPGPEPLDKEADEVMPGEDRGSGPA